MEGWLALDARPTPRAKPEIPEPVGFRGTLCLAKLGQEGDQVRQWLKHDGKPDRCREADGYETADNQ